MRQALVSIGLLLACASDASDPHHCGSPPLDCLGGACSNGQCTAWRLTTSPDFPTALVVDGDNLDWTTQSGDLFSVPTAGGTPTAVMHATNDLTTAIATTASSYYVASFNDGLLRIDRSSHDLFALDTGNVQTVATDVIGDVYWAATAFTGQSVAGVKRVRTGTNATEVLAPGQGSTVIAVDYAGVYWIDGASSSWGCTLGNDPCKDAQFPVRARFADGTFATYATATPSQGGLAADGNALYVADWCAGTVTRIEHADGATTVIASDLEWPDAVLVDDTSVYAVLSRRCDPGWFGGSTGNDAIVQIPKDGGPITTLRTLGRFPSAIALDDMTLYYLATDESPDASSTHQAVFAIAKPVQ